MSTILFWVNPVFWITLFVLSLYWVTGLTIAWLQGMATPTQMQEEGIERGMPWFGHFGFMEVAIVVHPVLAWATARMWPLWQHHTAAVVGCIIVAGYIGYFLQVTWSDMAGSSDAWSDKGMPNEVGVVHILHMSIEIGIMLMILVSAAWYREMPVAMFLGLLLVVLAHLFMGTHWPLKWWAPPWRPAGGGWENRLPNVQGYAFLTSTLMSWGTASWLLYVS